MAAQHFKCANTTELLKMVKFGAQGYNSVVEYKLACGELGFHPDTTKQKKQLCVFEHNKPPKYLSAECLQDALY